MVSLGTACRGMARSGMTGYGETRYGEPGQGKDVAGSGEPLPATVLFRMSIGFLLLARELPQHASSFRWCELQDIHLEASAYGCDDLLIFLIVGDGPNAGFVRFNENRCPLYYQYQ